MAKKKKFSQPGETEERIRWNKAKTRKWLTQYTVMEVHPPKKQEQEHKTKKRAGKTESKQAKSKKIPKSIKRKKRKTIEEKPAKKR